MEQVMAKLQENTGSQPTYEGLKQPLPVHEEVLKERSQPTYEGLKRAYEGGRGRASRPFPAYL